MPHSLKTLRDRLDAIDRRIVEALAERQRTVGEVVASKLKNTDTGIRDVTREEALLTRVVVLAEEHGADPVLVTRLYQQILEASVRWQQQQVVDRDNPAGPRVVAYMGRPGSYSHVAATRHFAASDVPVTLVGHGSFRALLDAVSDGSADLALLPIENTTTGSIDQALDLLGRSRLQLVGEEVQGVDHCLVGTADVPLDRIRRVYSHPQALLQCARLLERMPAARGEAWTDTAGAVAHIRDLGDPTAAAIASAEAAALHGLPILARGIADQPENFTRMVVVAKAGVEVDPRIPCKTSLFLATRRLAACLTVLDRHALTVSTLVARPRPHSPWQYRYYLDFEGNLAEPATQRAMEELAAETAWMRVLGSYPARTGVTQEPATPKPRAVAPAPRPAAGTVRVGKVLIGDAPVVVAAVADEAEALRAWREGATIAVGTRGDAGLDAARTAGLAVVVQVGRAADLRGTGRADGVWIAPAAMDDGDLLDAAAAVDRPVFLVRSPGASRPDWLAAAARLTGRGNRQVVLVDGGVHGMTGRTLDVAGLAALRQASPHPVLVDTRRLPPAAGTAALVAAATAVGAAGVVVRPDDVGAARDGLTR